MTKSASSAARRNGAQATHSSSRTITVPTFRGRDVVFVDPLDDKESYWWPAMIVPIPEIDPSMDCTVLNPGECLVKYFEDNKYSVVKFTELQPFIPTTIPFLEFESNAGQKFLKSGGVINALAYLESGKVKRKFSWQFWGTAQDDELDLTYEKQKPLRLPLGKQNDESSSSASPPSSSSLSTASNGHGKRGSTSGSSAIPIPITTAKDLTSSPAAARKRTAKHSASQDLATDVDKAMSPSRKRFSTPTALDTTAAMTDTSSSAASTPVTPDHNHYHAVDTKNGGVTASSFEKSSPSKTAAGASAGATGHLRAQNTSDQSVVNQAQTDGENSQQQDHEQQNPSHQQQQNTKGGRKRKARTNSTPLSSAGTSPSISNSGMLTEEPEEIKPEDNISPASAVSIKRTRSSTATSTLTANSIQDTTINTFPPPPPPGQPSSAALSLTQPATKRRRGKSAAISNGGSNGRAESVTPSSAPSSRPGSRHGSVDLSTNPLVPSSPILGRSSRSSSKQVTASGGQHNESDAERAEVKMESDASGQLPSPTTSTHGEHDTTETRGTDGIMLHRSQSTRSTPEPGASLRKGPSSLAVATSSGKRGRTVKQATQLDATGGENGGSMEEENDRESSSSVPSMSTTNSVSSDQVKQEQEAEAQAEDDTQMSRERRRTKLEMDSNASSSCSSSSSPTMSAMSVTMSVSVASVSMELDAFGTERREMLHKMQTVLPTLPMGSKEREAMYENCMDHLQKLRKEHQRLRQILQMTGASLDRRFNKDGRKASPSLSTSSGRSYRSSSRQQQNGIAKDYNERSSSPSLNGTRPSRAGTNRFYGRTR